MKNNKGNIVSYKEKIKGADDFNKILARIEVITDVLHSKSTNIEVAKKHGMHRNTVRNLMAIFNERVSLEDKNKLLSTLSLSKNEFIRSFKMLSPLSTKPKSNHRMANKEQEQIILDLHKKSGIGSKRMVTHIKRALDQADKRQKPANNLKELECLTYAKIKGVYKRNSLLPKKKRTASNTRINLYDYDTIAAFENLHYDTKTIPDLKAFFI